MTLKGILCSGKVMMKCPEQEMLKIKLNMWLVTLF